MKCPSCNQSASSWPRYTFTLQGVSFLKALQGFCKCQHCGATLRIISFGKQFWSLFWGSLLLIVLFTVFYSQLIGLIGMNPTALIWVLIIVLISCVIVYSTWKKAILTIVDVETPSNQHPSI